MVFKNFLFKILLFKSHTKIRKDAKVYKGSDKELRISEGSVAELLVVLAILEWELTSGIVGKPGQQSRN